MKAPSITQLVAGRLLNALLRFGSLSERLPRIRPTVRDLLNHPARRDERIARPIPQTLARLRQEATARPVYR